MSSTTIHLKQTRKMPHFSHKSILHHFIANQPEPLTAIWSSDWGLNRTPIGDKYSTETPNRLINKTQREYYIKTDCNRCNIKTQRGIANASISRWARACDAGKPKVPFCARPRQLSTCTDVHTQKESTRYEEITYNCWYLYIARIEERES